MANSATNGRKSSSRSNSNGKSDNNKKKEITISIRIEGQAAETIDAIAEHINVSRSELIRQAASNFISLALNNPEFPNPKLLLSHNELKILLDAATEETIFKIAYQSFINGKRDYAYIKKITQHLKAEEILKIDPEDEIKSVITNVLSEEGSHWFEKVQYIHKANKIIISGRHDLGKNFSLFIKHLLQYYMNDIHHKLIKTEFGEIEMTSRPEYKSSYLHLEFEKEIPIEEQNDASI